MPICLHMCDWICKNPLFRVTALQVATTERSISTATSYRQFQKQLYKVAICTIKSGENYLMGKIFFLYHFSLLNMYGDEISEKRLIVYHRFNMM